MSLKRKSFLITALMCLFTFGVISMAYADGPTTESNAIAIDTVWTMLAAFLVFLMHAGFTMVEAGFTRAKNAVNIIMKNMITVPLGFIGYFLVGFALMFGPSIGGFIGSEGFALISLDSFDFGIPTKGFWFFQAVFAATTATIVSGAMAERTKFLAYIVFTIVITSFIYPVVGHWIWGGGWLAEMGFTDFAGSTVVHSVGGWAALMGAYLLGPRIGKYSKDGKPKAIPGHNLPLGALGILLLWFGWFGFNAGSTVSGTSIEDITSILTTTALSASAGIISSMIVSVIKYGKPDASLTLNGALAGLVGITAGTAAVSPIGSLAIGFIAGIILVYAVEFIEKVLKVDDPVGAIAVHGICGVWGTFAVGLFALEGGSFYGGGIDLLLVQLTGIGAVFAWTMVMSFVIFKFIDVVIGLRVTAEEETEGLDLGEHGMKAYGDFVTPSRNSIIMGTEVRGESV